MPDQRASRLLCHRPEKYMLAAKRYCSLMHAITPRVLPPPLCLLLLLESLQAALMCMGPLFGDLKGENDAGTLTTDTRLRARK
jgi:hypothetical protein